MMPLSALLTGSLAMVPIMPSPPTGGCDAQALRLPDQQLLQQSAHRDAGKAPRVRARPDLSPVAEGRRSRPDADGQGAVPRARWRDARRVPGDLRVPRGRVPAASALSA